MQYWNVHQVLGQMLRTAEIDMADSVTPDDVDVFLDNRHGQFAPPITRSLKPPLVRQYLDGICSLTCRSLPTGTKLEITDNSKQILTPHRKTKNC
jgi:hypothetical protein